MEELMITLVTMKNRLLWHVQSDTKPSQVSNQLYKRISEVACSIETVVWNEVPMASLTF